MYQSLVTYGLPGYIKTGGVEPTPLQIGGWLVCHYISTHDDVLVDLGIFKTGGVEPAPLRVGGWLVNRYISTLGDVLITWVF